MELLKTQKILMKIDEVEVEVDAIINQIKNINF